MPKITVFDEKLGRDRSVVMTLDCLNSRMTVRELIRERIYQEVQDCNQSLEELNQKAPQNFLVVPSDVEQRLNTGVSAVSKTRKRRPVDWEKQVELACDAFYKNGFFVLVDDRQAEDLEERFDVYATTTVSFIKLVPLVGG